MQSHERNKIIDESGMTVDEQQKFWKNFDEVHFKNWYGRNLALIDLMVLNNFGNILNAGFDWVSTNEGYKYWDEIYCRLGKRRCPILYDSNVVSYVRMAYADSPGGEYIRSFVSGRRMELYD